MSEPSAVRREAVAAGVAIVVGIGVASWLGTRDLEETWRIGPDSPTVLVGLAVGVIGLVAALFVFAIVARLQHGGGAA